MIYDALERAYAILLANFATDMQALLTAKGVAGNATALFYKRQMPETFMALISDAAWAAARAGIGVYSVETSTQAKNQGRRVSENTLAFDYYAETPPSPSNDAVLLAKQTELAVEALLLSVDRISGSGAGVYGAGELEGSVTVKLTEAYVEAKQGTYARRATVTFPVHDEDTI